MCKLRFSNTFFKYTRKFPPVEVCVAYPFRVYHISLSWLIYIYRLYSHIFTSFHSSVLFVIF